MKRHSFDIQTLKNPRRR